MRDRHMRSISDLVAPTSGCHWAINGAKLNSSYTFRFLTACI